MDTTEKYIKMCEKAKKLQEEWEPKVGDFYAWAGYTVRRKGTAIVGIVRSYAPSTNLVFGMQTMPERRHKADVIWLFRQDDLQRMIKNFHYQRSLQELYKFSLNVPFMISSPEKLLLAFVTYERYGESWNDEREEWEVEAT